MNKSKEMMYNHGLGRVSLAQWLTWNKNSIDIDTFNCYSVIFRSPQLVLQGMEIPSVAYFEVSVFLSELYTQIHFSNSFGRQYFQCQNSRIRFTHVPWKFPANPHWFCLALHVLISCPWECSDKDTSHFPIQWTWIIPGIMKRYFSSLSVNEYKWDSQPISLLHSLSEMR